MKRPFYGFKMVTILVAFFFVATKSWSGFEGRASRCGDALSNTSIFSNSFYGGELEPPGLLSRVSRVVRRLTANGRRLESEREALRKELSLIRFYRGFLPLDSLSASVRAGHLPRQGAILFGPRTIFYRYEDEARAVPVLQNRGDVDAEETQFFRSSWPEAINSHLGHLFVSLDEGQNFFSYTRQIDTERDRFLLEEFRRHPELRFSDQGEDSGFYGVYTTRQAPLKVLIGRLGQLEDLLGSSVGLLVADFGEAFGGSSTITQLFYSQGKSVFLNAEEMRARFSRDPLYSLSERGEGEAFLVRAVQVDGVWKIREIKISDPLRPVTLNTVVPPLILQNGSRPTEQEVLAVKAALQGEAVLVARRYKKTPRSREEDVIEMYMRNDLNHGGAPKKIWELADNSFYGMGVSPQGDRLVIVASNRSGGVAHLAFNLRYELNANQRFQLAASAMTKDPKSPVIGRLFHLDSYRSYDPRRTPSIGSLESADYSVKSSEVIFSEDQNQYQIETVVIQGRKTKVLRSPVRVFSAYIR